MRKLILAAGAIALCSSGALAATDTPVTITGCVQAGTRPDTYVLWNVDEVTGHHAVPAGAVYKLSSTRGLKAHIGHKVEVRGTYTLARAFDPTPQFKVNTYSTQTPRTIAFESRARKAQIKDELRPVGTTGVMPTEVKGPYRRLEVGAIRMIATSCDVL